MKKIDLTGKRFDRLLVLEETNQRQGLHKIWKCVCDCGTEKLIVGKELREGKIKSCGCLRKELFEDKKLKLTGRKFGSLTALNEIEERATTGRVQWKCVCDCGNNIITTASDLVSGHTTSCGCKKSPNLIGRTFGKLTVLSQTEKRNFTCKVWLCICDCGNYKEVDTTNLVQGNTKSCGCLRSIVAKETHALKRSNLKYGSAFNEVFSSYRKNARRDNREFNIDEDKFYILTQSNCFYCGVKPSRLKKSFDELYYNGVDRLDNTRGYEENNVVPCCWNCNVLKGTRHKDEFIDWFKKWVVETSKYIETSG